MVAHALLLSALTLASGGRTDYRIVHPDDASAELRQWAGFLSETLQEMTGVRFPVVSAAQREAGAPAILFALPCAADRYEEYVVRTEGRDLVLSGYGSRGPALAVRHFLTRICGCRWYDGWTRRIPKVNCLEIPDLDIRRTPSFFFRRIFMGCGWGPDPAWRKPPYGMPRLPGRPIGRPGDIHTFYAFTRDWPKDRLDLLSMTPDGKRRPLKGAQGPNFCLSNPDGRQRFRKSLRGFIEQDRRDSKREGCEPPFIYCLSMNDCAEYLCHCPDCDRFQAAHGTSGLLLDFVNDMARDIAKDYPDIILETDAYAFAEEPPKGGMKAEPNVLVEVSRTKQNYYVPVEEDSGEAFGGYLKGWSKVAGLLGVWDYWVFYWDSFPAPYHNVHLIKRNLKWYHDLGTRMVRMESEQPNTASFRSLKAWLGDELMLDIDQDDRELIAGFMSGFYGAAAPEMAEFMELVAERQRGQVGKVFAKEGVYAPTMGDKVPRRKWLDADFYAKAEDIFTRAEAKVRNAEEQVRLNVLRERIPVDLSLLYVYDIIRPSVSKDALARRYLENRTAQDRLRIDPALLETVLAKDRAEVERLLRPPEAEKKSASPSAVPARTPEPRREKALEGGGVELAFDLTRLTIVPTAKGVEVKWRCRETEMSNIHARYDGGDWNVFSGDAVDFYFSPYLADATRGMHPAQYRFMMNPAATTLTAYDDAKWRSRSITSKRTFSADGWTSEWSIPYAALAAYDSRKKDGFGVLMPTAHWLFEIRRSRAATGARESLDGGTVRIRIPDEVLAPYGRLAMDRCTVENGTVPGEVAVVCRLKEVSGRPFAGRAKVLLYVGPNRSVVGTEDVRLEANGEAVIRKVLKLPQSAERFAAAVAVADEDNRCVRISRDIPIANPWVE